ncbi:VirB4 family type IV secretion/conjugal transfer ATPase [Novosphingobium flavum]|uniref:VirB4 family type IV secretion/conjugal transfer ATPase n=1 Tax=Novosphingobium aerophilum TaxID=2839843 RepID=UPI00163A49DE|nr:VirB4 family type IV secretion/conjugal transfer ATPase [Novosphingobium aerophilum]MBC2660269.1 VirB4 family type IV secretion/conjugal transfer ATPase [Novosphingobium aerophilum]
MSAATAFRGPAAWWRREARAGDRLPYAALVDPRTLRLRDGSLLQALQITGLPFETAEADQLDHLLAVRDVMLRAALDSSFVLYHHVVRRRVEVEASGTFANPFAGALDRAWQDRLRQRRLFVNDQYLALVRRPPRGKTGWPERIGRWFGRGLQRGSGRADPVTDLAPQRELDAAMQALASGLAAYGARPLGAYATPHGEANELLELLSLLYNGELKPVLTPAEGTDIGHHLPYARVSFGLDAVETRSGGWRDFAGLLGVKEYPPTTRAGILDGVLRLESECVLTESFAPVDRQIARERIDLSVRRLRAADDDTATERREMLLAKDALVSGQTGFGDHHLSLLVRAPSLPALDLAMAEAATVLGETGAVVVREDVNLEPGFWAQFPGNEDYAVRRALISTGNAAGFLSLHGFPLGQSDGNHWGEAIALFETTAGTPYFFNFHEGDLGHFTAIGPSGSGKTVAMNFLMAQAQKVRPRTVLFDKDRGSEIFVRALGGHYARIEPGQPTGFNPLRLEDTAANRAFLAEWLAALVAPRDSEEQALIAAAVDIAFQNDPALRRLRHFHELLAGRRRPEEGDLASRLRPWIHEGPHAWLFDNEVDALDLDQAALGFDMTALLDSQVLRTPTMMYLFHRIDQRLDGEPAMIVIDEGWKALDDAVFAARIRDWLKTLRKRNAVVGFATQSARDALDSRIASAIVEQTATQIFLPNAKARAEDYCDGFGLSAHELELIRALPAAGRCFLVRHAQHSVVVRLDLSGEPALLTVLSGREASVRRLDHLRETLGDHPGQWYEPLTGAPWMGAGA